MIIYVYLSLGLLSTICILAYYKLRITQDQSAQNPTFIKFQKHYIPIYLLAILGDWLQGPYLYRLYHHYGYMEHQVAVIYVMGLVSSALIFPAKDYLANKYGRRTLIVISSLVYSLSCLCTLSSNYVLLITGRCMAGMSNTLLFSTLEAWYVWEHLTTHDFPKEWIQVTFNHITFGSGIMAVIAGLVADAFARWFQLGPSSPFIVASPVLLLVIGSVLSMWKENNTSNNNDNTPQPSNNNQLSFEDIKRALASGAKAITPDVFLIGTIESLFESSLFMFVFIWTPAVGGKLKDSSTAIHVNSQGLLMSDIPLGVAFASFMVCFMLGGIIHDYFTHKSNYRLPNLLLPVTASGAILFLSSSLLSRGGNPSTFYRLLILLCLQLIEFACGFYFPIMRTLRDKVLPEEHRVSIIILFRVPLTLISAFVLLVLHNASGGVSEIFLVCAIFMMIALLCSIRFVKISGASSFNEEATNSTV